VKLLPPQVFPAAVFACALLSLGAPKVHAQAPVPFSASPVPENAVNSSSSLLPLDALAAGGLPSASAPAPGSFGEKPVEPYATKLYQAPFSRIGIGADVSPLGIGIKSAVVLNTFMDARLMGNFFQYNTGRFEVDGVNVYANVHLASVEALVDAYPWASVWRVSAGVMLMNGNQLSGTTRIASGTSFNLDGLTFYSANPNAATGATPVTGSGLLGFHANQPAAIISGGFGKLSRAPSGTGHSPRSSVLSSPALPPSMWL
jgi:hypothetical protein